MRRTPMLVLAALGLVFVPHAAAHAEATPRKVPADSVATIVLRVEGEESVPAIKIAVQLPSGLSEIRFRPARGWKRIVNGRVVTWSGGEIGHEEFGTFAFTARMPPEPGKQLVFPTVQTYANGKIVRWIGAETSDSPAPRVRLTAAKEPAPPPPPSVTTIATVQDEDKARTATWAVAAGIALGLFVIGLAFWWRRRR